MAHQETTTARAVTLLRACPATALRELGTWAGTLAHGTERGWAGVFAAGLARAACSSLLAAISVFLIPVAARAQAQCCVNPTAETTAANSGSNGDPTYPYASDFVQYINESLSYPPVTVTESEGRAALDGCHFTNSAIPAQNQGVNGFTWDMEDGVWGEDVVGWVEVDGQNPVTYYRQHGRAPCGFTMYQKLHLNCNLHYYVGPPGNTLTATINTSTVENCRYEQLPSDSIPYGFSSACQTLNK